ncbi:MAG: helix-turn-helix domain-containing protein [Firmicutes bacterium]|nr:helix-turn-helix domain-containing protein [Bacillota bacterium]
MNEIIESLKSIYFSEQEAKIYLYLLENPGQTVFLISKNLHISRSSVYPIIEKLKSDGILLLEYGPKELYYAEDP